MYAHLFFVLLSVFELGSPSGVVKNGGRRGRQFFVRFVGVYAQNILRTFCGGVCPVFLCMIAAYAYGLRRICGSVC